MDGTGTDLDLKLFEIFVSRVITVQLITSTGSTGHGYTRKAITRILAASGPESYSVHNRPLRLPTMPSPVLRDNSCTAGRS